MAALPVDRMILRASSWARLKRYVPRWSDWRPQRRRDGLAASQCVARQAADALRRSSSTTLMPFCSRSAHILGIGPMPRFQRRRELVSHGVDVVFAGDALTSKSFDPTEIRLDVEDVSMQDSVPGCR